MADSEQSEDPVAKRKALPRHLAAQRELCRDLYDGQDAVHAKRERYLPVMMGESVIQRVGASGVMDSEYEERLRRSMLDNRVEEAASFAVGQVTKDDIELEDDVPVEIRGIEEKDGQSEQIGWDENIDLRGNDLTQFSSEIFRDYWIHGVAGFLVTMPEVVDEVGGAVLEPTKAQFSASGVRPYWVRYDPNDIWWWDWEYVNGVRRLRHLRLHDCSEVANGDLATEMQEKILCFWAPRVGNEFCTYQEYLKVKDPNSGKERWVAGALRTMNGTVEIPFNFFGDPEGAPPLLSLAHMNLFHYQRLSDKDTWEHYSCLPVLYATGCNDDQVKNGVAWSARKMIRFANPQAKISTPEFFEAGPKLIKESIRDLEEKMAQRAMRSILENPRGDVTATATVMAGARAATRLQAAWLAFVDTLERGLQQTAMIGGLGEDGGCVNRKREFFDLPKDAQIFAFIQWLHDGKRLSGVSTFAEAKRYGVIDASLDYEAEQEKIAEEDKSAGNLGSAGTSSAVAMRAMEIAGVDPATAEAAMSQAESEVVGPPVSQGLPATKPPGAAGGGA